MSYYDYVNAVSDLVKGSDRAVSLDGLTVSGIGIAQSEGRLSPSRVVRDALAYISDALKEAYGRGQLDSFYEAVAQVLPSSTVSRGGWKARVLFDPVSRTYYADDGSGWVAVSEGMENELIPLLRGYHEMVISELQEQEKGIEKLLGMGLERGRGQDHGGYTHML